jgi:hydroxyacylglutathione hydrolase
MMQPREGLTRVVPFVHEGLGNSSYLVEVGPGEAALIDPDRSIHRYLVTAEELGLDVAAIFETHLHADFVTGSVEARAATGATIFLPIEASPAFPHGGLRAGEVVKFGEVEVAAIASPGHTPEHLSYLFGGVGPAILFSGGSLLVGGAARTDLIDPSMTDSLTRAQHRTLHRAFRDLPDDTVLMPTHGGGSFCSSGQGGSRTSTLGDERRTNALLRIEDEEEFASWFPTTFPAVPTYFTRMRAVNRSGPRLRRDIAPPAALDPDAFGKAIADGAIVVDVRSYGSFAGGHIPGALSDPFRPAFGVWLGWLAPESANLAFVIDDLASLADVVDESLLVGQENFTGWLEGGMDAWELSGRPVARLELVDAEEARALQRDGALAIDVREPDEFARGHVPRALSVPVGEVEAWAGEIPRDRPLIAYCGHGERSSSALSILERLGYGRLHNLDGGLGAWEGVHDEGEAGR